MKLLTSILLFFVFVQIFCAEKPYKKIIHNTDPEAKCLDGSPALLYLHEGGDTTNILIFFYGGGFCGQPTLSDTI
jgi:hypothetical protein